MNHKLRYKIIIFVLFSLLLVTFVILDTYALFETNGTASSQMTIGAWKILVNNTDISQNNTITLSNFNYTSSSHTENGYFAPGTTATFDIIMDASQSNVSVQYELVIDDSQIEDYPNINFTVLNVDTNQTVPVDNISGVIPLNAVNRTVTLRMSLTWSDNLQYDESDTSLIDSDLSFAIAANFKQYVGE